MKLLLTALLMSCSLCVAAQSVATDEPPKTTAAKKTEPKKAPPKKVAAKKATPVKGSAPNVYVNDPKAPTVFDKTGNAIPTNPNAYDVSSAVGKK